MEQYIKIFVPLGTQKFPFERLINALNNLIERGFYSPDEILIQSAYFPIEPKCKFCFMIPQDKYEEYIKHSELVITHSGVNTIILAMEMNKPLLIVPRLKKYGEHVDDHQLEIAEIMEDKYDVMVVRDLTNLSNYITCAKSHKYKSWESHRMELIMYLKAIIDKI